MRTIVAGIVAIGALWLIDIEFNQGRYTDAAIRMSRPILGLVGIYF